MGCLYSDFNGKCQMFSEDGSTSPQGCSDDGDCCVEENPVPADNCESYETDSGCHHCGADYNQDEECTCGD